MAIGRVIPVFALAVAVAVGMATAAIVRAVVVDPTGALRPEQLLMSRVLQSSEVIGELQRSRSVRFVFSGFSPISVWLEPLHGEAQRTTANLVDDTFFDVTTPGVPFPLGQGFFGSDRAVVLSYRMWERGFRRSPDVVGSSVRINGIQLTIVGVAPKSFRGLDPVNPATVFVNASGALELGLAPSNSNVRWLRPVARDLGVVRASAVVTDRSGVLTPTEDNGVKWLPLGEARGEYAERRLRVTALLLSTLAGLTVIGALVSYGLWFITEVEYRLPEMVLRVMLGSGRVRAMLNMCRHALIPLGPSIVMGVLGSMWLLDALDVMSALGGLPVPLQATLSATDVGTGAVAIGLLSIACWIPGLLRLATVISDDLSARFSGHTGGRSSVGIVRSVAISAQMALTIVAAACGVGSLLALQGQTDRDTGYRTDEVTVTTPRFRSQPADVQGLTQLQSDIAGTPGVLGTAIADLAPLGNLQFVRDFAIGSSGSSRRWAYNEVSSNYFAVLGVPFLAGRNVLRAADEAVVNQAVVDELGGWDKAIGEALIVKGPNQGRFEIVGVVADTTFENLLEERKPIVYLPRSDVWDGNASLLVRIQRPEAYRSILGLTSHNSPPGRF